MERVAKLGSRHVNIMASRAEPPIWHESWDRFWSIAEESGIPVGSHIAVLTFNQPQTDKPVYSNNAVDRAVGGFRVNSQLVEPVCGLIFGGVLDRHPKLKFVMGESDLAWIPYIWSRTPNDPPFPGGPKLPTREYFQRQIWMTFIQDSAGVEMVKAGIFEPDKAMWSSDYPHPASSWPDSQPIIEKVMAGVDDRPQEEAAVPERGRPLRALKEMPHLSRRAFVRGVGATLLLGPGLLSACGVTTAPPAATNPPAPAATAATSAPAAATVPPAATTAPARRRPWRPRSPLSLVAARRPSRCPPTSRSPPPRQTCPATTRSRPATSPSPSSSRKLSPTRRSRAAAKST